MAAPSFIQLVKGAAADLASAAADAVRIFVDDGTGEPSYKDDAGVVTSLVGAAGADGADGADAPPLTYEDHGNTGATETVDASAADVHRLILNAATVTLTLSGWPASGTPALIRLWIERTSGGEDLVLPGAVDFGDPGEPDWTSRSAGAIDIVDLMSTDGGTTIIAVLAGREGPQGPPGADGADGTGAGTLTTIKEVDGSPSDTAIEELLLPNGTLAIAAHVATFTPPGYEYDYVESTTADTSITASAEASADVIITANAVTYDGTTKIVVEVFLDSIALPENASTNAFIIYLFDGSSSLGTIGTVRGKASDETRLPLCLKRRLTPSSGAHTYSARAIVLGGGTGHVYLGPGGDGETGPGYIRQTKA